MERNSSNAFSAWFYEKEGIALRAELIYEDTDGGDPERVAFWIRMAFDAGRRSMGVPMTADIAARLTENGIAHAMAKEPNPDTFGLARKVLAHIIEVLKSADTDRD